MSQNKTRENKENKETVKIQKKIIYRHSVDIFFLFDSVYPKGCHIFYVYDYQMEQQKYNEHACDTVLITFK